MAIAYPSETPPSDLASFDVRVTGPECDVLSEADLRRLFPGSSLTQPRLDRLREWPRVVVRLGGRIVAAATCKKTEVEMRVPDIGIDAPPPTCCGGVCRCSERDIVNALLDAVELASIAGGCRRVIVNPPRVSMGFLERRGYVGVNERCAGGWIEKTIGE
ncbi:MAG: hypothetical protein A3H96_10065 [Acidobacteria bacterium RIFCSPLOWO2_02_FULL_67_36]|nr:MAG: hypothetical protein A3H96_10065 [Acidobacteria bacterium RIFCSPLOWO2_02_FULL_67_36]OFW24473.1 MAG: hypothetical protein A3G21_18100 [Acidobacteria bacterium RIFCSPLOWO2_12_FULL_66_21]